MRARLLMRHTMEFETVARDKILSILE